MSNKQNTRFLAILVSVFFFWGFVAASNDILIPVFKEKLNLEQWQSQMIAFAFYVAYTLGSIIYIIVSKIINHDLVKKIGFGRGISLGLFISALGTLLFIPAANLASFSLLLTGLIIVGVGFSLQQTAANPLAILLGNAETGSQRLSLAGGINNIGTTIGPLLVSVAIFGKLGDHSGIELDVTALKIPYLILGALFALFGIIFWGLKTQESHEQQEVSAIENNRSALHYPQLWMGMIAIFLYVGVEVSTASNLPEFLKQKLEVSTGLVAPYISLFWASLMIGRWASAASAFSINKSLKHLLQIILPFIAFGIFLTVNYLANVEIKIFYIYSIVILVLIVADFASKGSPANQLLIYSVLGATALIIGILSEGWIAMYAFISVGLFCSTLWPCIFTLAISGLKDKTAQGSNYLIMMIMGGGFVSVFQGFLASDNYLGIQQSYWVGVICFAYLAYYAIVTKRNLINQGLEINNSVSQH